MRSGWFIGCLERTTDHCSPVADFCLLTFLTIGLTSQPSQWLVLFYNAWTDEDILRVYNIRCILGFKQFGLVWFIGWNQMQQEVTFPLKHNNRFAISSSLVQSEWLEIKNFVWSLKIKRSPGNAFTRKKWKERFGGNRLKKMQIVVKRAFISTIFTGLAFLAPASNGI